MSWLRAMASRYRVSDDPLRTVRKIELLVLLLAALLCLQLGYSTFRFMTLAAPVPVVPAADSLHVPAVRGLALVSAEERNEIVGRPLFWASRRPLEVVAKLQDPKAISGELKDIKLVGLFGSGEQAGIIALVKGKKQRILLGDTVEGWTLKSVQPSELVVSNGKRTETLVLQQGTVSAKPFVDSAATEVNGQPAAKRVRQKSKVKSASSPQAIQTAPAEMPEAERSLGLGPQR